MTNLYEAPKADVADAPLPPSRSAGMLNAIGALASTAGLGPLLILVVVHAFVGEARIPTEVTFWTVTLIAACTAAATVYPLKNLPMWMAIALGPLFFLAGMAAYWFWSDVWSG